MSKKTNYAGIDYSHGQSNIDKGTGIRFGVISQHSVMTEALEDVEYIYPGPNCPKCGNDALDYCEEYNKDDAHISADYVCHNCKWIFDSSEVKYDREGYQLTDCHDTDIFVIKSPFYTFAQFCSPCVPGACNLDSTLDLETIEKTDLRFNNNRCYCLGHDWFENECAPYDVYSVETGQKVEPK